MIKNQEKKQKINFYTCEERCKKFCKSIKFNSNWNFFNISISESTFLLNLSSLKKNVLVIYLFSFD